MAGARAHAARDTSERALRVAGVPALWDDELLAKFFGQFGAVESAAVGPTHHPRWPGLERGQRWREEGEDQSAAGTVVFEDGRGRQRALSAGVPAGGQRRPKAHSAPPLGSGGGPTRGLNKWVADYRASRPGAAALQELADKTVVEYEARQEQERREREAKAAEEDGWTLVVGSGGRKKSTEAATGTAVAAVAAAAAAEAHRRKKPKQTQQFDFYRFQHREARRNEILELQQRFEEDKRRVARLRAARKFKPY